MLFIYLSLNISFISSYKAKVKLSYHKKKRYNILDFNERNPLPGYQINMEV